MKRLAVGLLITMLLGMTFPANAQESTHVVQSGENLFRIALGYGLTTEQLAAANGIVDVSQIYAGQELVLPNAAFIPPQPVAAGPQVPAEVVETPAEQPLDVPELIVEPQYYIVQRGDGLQRIADQFGLTAQELIELNNIANPNLIFPGEQLIVGDRVVNVTPAEGSPEPVVGSALPLASGLQQSTLHTVQVGEHLAQIARTYDVPWTLIAVANDITDPDNIFAGQTLTIPGGAEVAELQALIMAPPQPHVGVGREIVVDLSNSSVYAYIDGALVYEALGSTGLPSTPTVQGSFAVWNKTRSQTMSGPGYSLPNVECVLYFYQGYAVHGAYWHQNWGQPMSHGCVNLPNEDARYFYEFAEVGTPVTVQL